MKSSVVATLQCLSLGLLAGSAIASTGSGSKPGQASSCCTVQTGYNPELAVKQAQRLSANSWEFGTTSQALLELYDPSLAVFAPGAFANDGQNIPTVSPSSVRSLVYARPNIALNSTTLVYGDGATGDPASLGVSALLIGQTNSSYRAAAARQAKHLLYQVPKWPNGAISQREDVAELWADFVFMAPPFLAYYAVATNNATLLRYTAKQCDLYRQVLQPADVPTGTTSAGNWRHIIGPQSQDTGLWSTGNGWAAMGMSRVLATAQHWKPTACDTGLHSSLSSLIGQIATGAMHSPKDPSNGLLYNYLNDTTWFGEISGTSAITAAVYRVAVLQSEISPYCPPSYGSTPGSKPITPALLAWADANRNAVAKHVNSNGIASPAVDPYNWYNRTAYTTGSPEGESFITMMYAAYRDCVSAKVCKSSS